MTSELVGLSCCIVPYRPGFDATRELIYGQRCALRCMLKKSVTYLTSKYKFFEAKAYTMLTPFRNQQAHGESSLQLLCAGRSDRLGRVVRLGCRDELAVDLRTSAWEGPHQS
jgi:hypothetical protein